MLSTFRIGNALLIKKVRRC